MLEFMKTLESHNKFNSFRARTNQISYLSIFIIAF